MRSEHKKEVAIIGQKLYTIGQMQSQAFQQRNHKQQKMGVFNEDQLACSLSKRINRNTLRLPNVPDPSYSTWKVAYLITSITGRIFYGNQLE